MTNSCGAKCFSRTFRGAAVFLRLTSNGNDSILVVYHLGVFI